MRKYSTSYIYVNKFPKKNFVKFYTIRNYQIDESQLFICYIGPLRSLFGTPAMQKYIIGLIENITFDNIR